MEVLSPEELRVLGCLIEKESTTPDQYPLTMNSLLLACNQQSNRNPIVAFDQNTVDPLVARLRELKLVRVVHQPGGRADKYRHVADETWALTRAELAVLAVLALRGPQTVNELRTRTERYSGLEDLGGVDGVLHRLKNRYDEPYVIRLEREPGRREERWAHLLSGEVIMVATESERSPRAGGGGGERISALEEQVAALRHEVELLRLELSEFRSLLE